MPAVQFGFIIFEQKIIGTKAACEMFVKLTSELHVLSIVGWNCNQFRILRNQSLQMQQRHLSGNTGATDRLLNILYLVVKYSNYETKSQINQIKSNQFRQIL